MNEMNVLSATGLFTQRFGLDRHELLTSAFAAVVSTGLYLAYGDPYLARGVVGDLLGFAVLSVPLVTWGHRCRHEAFICLVGIGLVHALGLDWPLRLSSLTWWLGFLIGLAGYVMLRQRRLP